MSRRADEASSGLTLVAVILWAAGLFVAVRGDMARPWLAFAVFGVAGAAAFTAGRLIGRGR